MHWNLVWTFESVSTMQSNSYRRWWLKQRKNQINFNYKKKINKDKIFMKIRKIFKKKKKNSKKKIINIIKNEIFDSGFFLS